jgi:N-acyl-L-homoserine lactone synthetase
MIAIDRVDLVVARRPDERRAVGELRYRVYCEERRWEPAWRFPDGVESDHFDARATQLLLRDRATGAAAGCVRLVLCDPADPAAPFPFEASAADQLDPDCDLARAPRASVGEASRFAVAPEYRGHHGSEAARISLLLAVSAGALSVELGLDRVVAFSTAGTMRVLAAVGLRFRRVGGFVESHGARAPYEMTVTELLSLSDPSITASLAWARAALRSQVRPRTGRRPPEARQAPADRIPAGSTSRWTAATTRADVSSRPVASRRVGTAGR